jgi:hypothetical protein
MTIKTGTYTGQTSTAQPDNTVDITVNPSYIDGTSESSIKVADNTMRITPNRAKPIITPLNATSFPLASDPDTTFARPSVSTGTITTVAGSLLVDGETFVLNDGVNPAVTFEFDSNASVVQSNTLRAVAFTGGDTANTVRDTIITAVSTAPVLNITATSGGASLVNLVNDTTGHAGNVVITETVAAGGFIVAGMLGGATGDIRSRVVRFS